MFWYRYAENKMCRLLLAENLGKKIMSEDIIMVFGIVYNFCEYC